MSINVKKPRFWGKNHAFSYVLLDSLEYIPNETNNKISPYKGLIHRT